MTQTRPSINLPPENIWMLAVDGKFYLTEKGPEGFEAREPGSVKGILNGLAVALEYSDKDLTIEHIQTIHRTCMQGIKSQNPCQPGHYRENSVNFSIQGNWLTVKGLQHFFTQAKGEAHILFTDCAVVNNTVKKISTLSKDEKKNLKLACDTNNKLTTSRLTEFKNLSDDVLERNLGLIYITPNPKIIAEEMKSIVNQFNKNIKIASTDDEKLLTIILTIKQFVQLHPFRDGNNRTFINCLLTSFLMKHLGQFPIFFDPNIFEFHAPDELVKLVKEALQIGQFMQLKPKDPIFGYTNLKLNSYFTSLGNDFLYKISGKTDYFKYIQKNFHYNHPLAGTSSLWSKPFDDKDKFYVPEEEYNFKLKIYQA